MNEKHLRFSICCFIWRKLHSRESLRHMIAARGGRGNYHYVEAAAEHWRLYELKQQQFVGVQRMWRLWARWLRQKCLRFFRGQLTEEKLVVIEEFDSKEQYRFFCGWCIPFLDLLGVFLNNLQSKLWAGRTEISQNFPTVCFHCLNSSISRRVHSPSF